MFKLLIIIGVLILQPYPSVAGHEDSTDGVAIIDRLAKMVSSRNFSSIMLGSFEDIRQYLPGIIEKCEKLYKNQLQNVDAVLDYIKAFPKEYQLMGYGVLLEAMQKNDHIWSEQGFKVADLVSSVDRKTSLKELLPASMRSLYFGEGSCKIKSSHFNEYFFAGHQRFNFDEYRHNTFTWTNGILNNNIGFDIRKTRENIFTFMWNNKYLYADYDNYAQSAQRRRVFTYRSKNAPDNREWEIKPKAHQPNVFRLRNVGFNEYLFADPDLYYDKNMRHTFTERISGFAINSTLHWILEC